MAVQRNLRINQLGEERRNSFGDYSGKERWRALGRAVLLQASPGEMTVFMGNQEGEVLEIPKPLQSQGDYRKLAHLHGDSIGAEKSDEKIDRGVGFPREDRLAAIQCFCGQNGWVLPLNKGLELTVIRFLDLPDSGGDLIQVEMVEIPPVGHQEFFMGLQVEAQV